MMSELMADLIRYQAGDQLKRLEGSALGLLRRQPTGSATSRSFAALPPELRRQARTAVPLVITKANRRSTVHRPVLLDYHECPTSSITRAMRSASTSSSACSPRPPTPQSARDPAAAPEGRAGDRARRLRRAARMPARHSSTSSRPFRATSCSRSATTELFEIAPGILHLQERQRAALFLRRDPFERFLSCFVYVPRDRYNTDFRERIQGDPGGGVETAPETEFYAQISRIRAGPRPVRRSQRGRGPRWTSTWARSRRLIEAAHSWSDRLRDALIDAHGEEGATACPRYRRRVSRSATPSTSRRRAGRPRHRPRSSCLRPT